MDTVCLKSGISCPLIVAKTIFGGSGAFDPRTNPSNISATMGRPAPAANNAISLENPPSKFGFPLRFPWTGGGDRARHNGMAVDEAVLVQDKKLSEGAQNNATVSGSDLPSEKESWILKILRAKSRWTEEGKAGGQELEKDDEGVVRDAVGSVDDRKQEEDDECDVCRVDDEEETGDFISKDSFSKLLRRVTLTEARLYAQMSYLGNLAYSIPNIKPPKLLRYYNLRFVTSSMELEKLSTKSGVDEKSPEAMPKTTAECSYGKNSGYGISVTAAYEIVASAASYLHYHTKSILPFKSNKKDNEPFKGGNHNAGMMMSSDVVSFIATTDSVTAVVAAKEEVKQAVADNLNSRRSSPCEWFICDDDESGTRFFVIQGSESMSSWQANLLFEPVQFEGMDVVVHRGIYEAAKGMYEQMLPEVHAHMKLNCHRASYFYFTGHSLGGSLALLVNLMLLIRGEVPLRFLLPVITFGSPSVMCGGDRLLRTLGLPPNHVRAITMHRDIVPRAFSCRYPDRVADLLKAVNRKFRNHPCLNRQKLLYGPVGEVVIVQPDKRWSPHHDLLPEGSGFYVLTRSSADSERQIGGAQRMFLNSPHPLDVLRDRSSYGSEGTIERDHDMKSYVKCIRGEFNSMRRAERAQRRRVWWRFKTSSRGFLQNAKLRALASPHLLMLFFPARLLLFTHQIIYHSTH